MITLYTFPSGFGQFSYSPFCTKAAWLLNLASVEWTRQDMNDPRKMPMAKLPAIGLADGTIIADSDNIRSHLEQLGHDFDAGLSPRDRATSRAFIRMAEEHIYFHQVIDRWGDEANWAVIRKAYFGFLPPVLRPLVTSKLRRDLMRTMHGLGLGRMTVQQRLDRVAPDLEAIVTQLGERPFLFGDTPSAADASVGSLIGGIMAAPVPTPLSRRVSGDAVLSAYAARCAEAMG
ncbi:glutathione S-transferase family protein [uncultured Sulfitobacter sp.]|uniref:glutathione S-transferase family protein n=1 Tax=uncultured Sulfitobacter sp. TaxID=191468 RepID=UPI002612C5BC|nr:glutathione S-transferase family protein [uncultured Sulfitobacter sp.]